MTLAEALGRGRANNLDALRLAAAAAVIVSHAWPLALGAGTAEPLEALTGHSLGGWALALFFFLSGLLIPESAARRTTAAFWTARARRLLPGLAGALVATLVLAALTGGEVTPARAAAYLARGLTLVSLEHHIPGAFPGNPMAGTVNGPLWSLAHEVAAYTLCLLAVRSGLMARLPLALPVLALALWAAQGLPARAATFAPLFLAFSLGMTAWRFRARWPVSPALALALALAAPLGWPLAVAALGQAALVLGFRTRPLGLKADLSFGLYLYGWPVAQTVLHVLPGIGAPALAGLSLLATLPLAAMSWQAIERPALRLKPAVA